MNDKHMPPQPPAYGFASAPTDGSQNYPPQGYPQQGYLPQGYPPQGYPQQAYPQPGYPVPPPSFAPPQSYGATPPQSYGPAPPPHAYGPTPPQNYGARPPQMSTTIITVQPNGWYNRNQRNKPQSNAVGAAALIFISGGMNIAWSIGFHSWYFSFAPLHTRVAWFIGAIIGGVLSCFVANKLPKKIVFCFCSLLVMIGGVLMAATTFNIRAIEASLYLDGIANGLAFAPALALTGEVSVPYMRGVTASTIEQMCYMTGFFIQVIYMTSWNTSDISSFNGENMHGVLSAVYGLIGLIVACLLCIESPVILLANGNEQQALDALRRLQRPYTMTTETFVQLEEHKRYLAQNAELSTGQSIVQAMPALLRLCYLRALNAMSLSVFVLYALVMSQSLLYISLYTLTWQYIVYSGCRWLPAFIISLCVESAGRKKPTLLGLLGCGGMAIGIAKLIYDLPYIDRDALFIIVCIFQVFAGIAFSGTSAYLTEAFPLSVKQHCIAFTFIVEMLIYIITSSASYSQTGHGIYFCILAGLCLLGFLLGIWCLPETRRTTLRESQEKFKGFLSKGF
ncbi:PREDICTED: solute carrier family 2, facilitated glucose transporter member 4 [Drosophila arizonae]|uniref:Solute carrier family 2, facilitated glucose transporter member 4 n=1 Tax=Drosophila arizonae TaxID=7263 RepID=A0ABM1P8H1_DROAR|nr:PREDICTED: solute carrier family 2, facilitated glucose transporter member 4 [Drosophila arizonae]XP_017863507.1 PREDICTED: solute carrier family 2, facilitated glucose transporter member 4 [Drosophila arizonae]